MNFPELLFMPFWCRCLDLLILSPMQICPSTSTDIQRVNVAEIGVGNKSARLLQNNEMIHGGIMLYTQSSSVLVSQSRAFAFRA